MKGVNAPCKEEPVKPASGDASKACEKVEGTQGRDDRLYERDCWRNDSLFSQVIQESQL